MRGCSPVKASVVLPSRVARVKPRQWGLAGNLVERLAGLVHLLATKTSSFRGWMSIPQDHKKTLASCGSRAYDKSQGVPGAFMATA
jgi:hypothetical protein